jgi:hypothetical protein
MAPDLHSVREGRLRPTKGHSGGPQMDVKGAQALAERIAEAARQNVSPTPAKAADPHPAIDAPRRDDGGNPVSPKLDAAA